VKILLVAEESAGLQTLRMLLDVDQAIAAVLTSDRPATRGATVGDLARGSGVSVLDSRLVMDPAFASWISDHDVDLMLNIHSLFVIHAAIVAAPKVGSFNLHPGPLPQYAGLNVPSWAIYNGEETHAVTLHWMNPGIDTGPIAYADEFEITDEDTGLSVSVKCARRGLPLVERLLAAAERDPTGIPRIEQDLAQRRYFSREAPQQGRIEWNRPAAEIVRFVRAADYAPFRSPWGHPVATLDGRVFGIARATLTGASTTEAAGTVAAAPGDALYVAAGDEWIELRRLDFEKKYVRPTDVLAPSLRLGDG
jgi:methionyl-tRNA formyltransferase